MMDCQKTLVWLNYFTSQESSLPLKINKNERTEQKPPCKQRSGHQFTHFCFICLFSRLDFNKCGENNLYRDIDINIDI